LLPPLEPPPLRLPPDEPELPLLRDEPESQDLPLPLSLLRLGRDSMLREGRSSEEGRLGRAPWSLLPEEREGRVSLPLGRDDGRVS